jgi:hypothetical protein
MRFDEILARFPDAKKSGDGWAAKCPAHLDGSPSLSICEGSDGRTLLYDHAGCTPQAICDAVGLTLADLFPPRAVITPTPATNGSGKRIVATYDYTDAGGKLLFQVVRYDPKDFRQRRPDATAPDGWTWKTSGIEKVLFRLPEIIRAIAGGKFIFINEGERDTLAMVQSGFDATCNPGGAGKWLAGYTETLRGADVVIIADKDKPGRDHAQLVAGKLHGVAKSVRILELPDVDGHPVKDAADFFAAGGTAETIFELVDTAPIWTPQTAPEKNATRVFILPNDHTPISESGRNIFAAIAGTHTLFVRAGSIVELVRRADGCSLELIKPESFRSRIERYGHQLVAWKIDDDGGKVMKPKRCSEDNARALLATVEAREVLPIIHTVAAAPVIVPDGDGVKVLGQGYHVENGGTLVVGGETPPELPANEAAKLLLDTLNEFVFQCAGDKARAFGAMLTPALKMGGFIRGFIPVDVREADQPQTGKGFSLNLVRAIYHESAYPIALKSGGDESLCAALLSGKPFIAIDNVRGKLDSQFLEMILTWGDAVAARIPHRGEVLVDPGATSFQLTSNGIEATPDFAKRASITRMLKQRPGFAFKKYVEGDLRDHIAANQPRYLGAVFALIRDWCRRGKPTTNATGHDFREWAGILDAFTVYHMGENLLTGHEQAQERTANPAMSWLRAVGLLVLKTGKAGRELPAAELYELSADDQLAIPGMRQPDDQQGPQIVGRVLAKCFRDGNRVEVDHLTVERITNTEYDPNSRKDITRKAYRFTEADLRTVRTVRTEG